MASREILLVLEVSVGREEDFESLCLGCRNQVTVLQLGPASFPGCLYPVLDQSFAKRCRRALIEQDIHSGRFQGAASRVLEHGPGLFGGDPRKPIDEIVKRGVVLKVLEQRRNRHARPCEDPSSADATGVPFSGRASRPIDHLSMLALGVH